MEGDMSIGMNFSPRYLLSLKRRLLKRVILKREEKNAERPERVKDAEEKQTVVDRFIILLSF